MGSTMKRRIRRSFPSRVRVSTKAYLPSWAKEVVSLTDPPVAGVIAIVSPSTAKRKMEPFSVGSAYPRIIHDPEREWVWAGRVTPLIRFSKTRRDVVGGASADKCSSESNNAVAPSVDTLILDP